MASYYDAIAGGYDELHGAEQKEKANVVLKNIKLADTDTILDVGGGTGFATRHFPGKRVVLEPSEGLRGKVDGIAIAGVAENLPFPDNTFTLVICLTAIHHFDDARKALEEMKRVSEKYVAISLLKKAVKFAELDLLIRKELKGCEIMLDKHDMIYLFESIG